jgi:Protein of unknown function DUF104
MTTAVKAIYENGVFKPTEPVQLQERTEVEVLIPVQSLPDDDPTRWAAAKALIGFRAQRGIGRVSGLRERASKEPSRRRAG